MLSVAEISSKIRTLRAGATDRDQIHSDLHNVRAGDIDMVFPQMFSADFPAPVIANFIDVAARDCAEQLAPLPAFNCSASNMTSDKARLFADKKAKGISHYLLASHFQRQMYSGADYFVTYGFMPVLVDPDYKLKVPRMYVMDPRNCYYELDRTGRCLTFTKVFSRTIAELCALYPEYAPEIQGPFTQMTSQSKIDLALYRDDDQYVMFIPERHDLVLDRVANPLGECPVVIAERPGVTDTPRGQFDDVMWVQVARNRFAMLAMQAAEQTVDAPLALPFDVQEFQMGPLAALRTNSPEKIHKVAQDIPQAAFLEGQMLDQEMSKGARYPDVRTGQSPASSIVTGQSIKALEGGFDGATRAAQDVFADAFTEIIRLCLKTDERHWPDEERSIRGLQDGVPFELKWKPSRDIDHDYTVDISYGFASGLDPNRSLVFILQLLGGGLISKDLARRQFPFGLNVTQEEQRIEIEELRSAIVQSVAGYAQAVPILAEQGQDPSEILGKLAAVVKGRQKGTPIEDVVQKAFAPPAPPPGQQAPGSGGPASMGPPGEAGPGGGDIPQGMNASGLPYGIAPGQAAMGPGGSPDLMQMIAGLNNAGAPSSSANVRRRLPTG